MNCVYCEKSCKNANSLRNHERLCKENPDRDLTNTEAGRLKAIEKTEECEYCHKMFSRGNIKRHMSACKSNPDNFKICPVCDTSYNKDGVTCSYSCSNTYFRHKKEGGAFYKSDEWLIENGKYQDLCFRHHKKKCIVCGEEKIVAVHHIDCDHSNNQPNNLVPLCPTHHQYMHSRYKCEIEPYITEFLNNLSLV